MTDTTTESKKPQQVRPLGDHYASSEPAEGSVETKGDHYASGEPAEGSVETKGDHYASGEPKAAGHVPERDTDGEVETKGDHYASGEPKDKPGPVAPVDHYAS
ncbi:hypothetical protein SAMN06297387_111138 [Streptomyces zhaozhouensis]|uniref:Uncharacterized protein n=1 Tax=Streptomyces zhaozhouensis TaxID=1300267 RepID=A0A286DY46_9ACTN|nr:hypothetical protein [Streptomyces zhaozhouensis]SOD63589.1 hypothetical protein SAMN06297387_111138 [Streptomyces zhaozhouensis]